MMDGVDIVQDEPVELQSIAPVLPVSERSALGEETYQIAKQRGLLLPLADEPSLHEFTYWRIIVNRFPYDMVYRTSHLLLPRREVGERYNLTPDELYELEELLNGFVDDHYDRYIVNTVWRRSIQAHYHIHLLNFVEGRGDIQL